jgi:hypothetical protein
MAVEHATECEIFVWFRIIKLHPSRQIVRQVQSLCDINNFRKPGLISNKLSWSQKIETSAKLQELLTKQTCSISYSYRALFQRVDVTICSFTLWFGVIHATLFAVTKSTVVSFLEYALKSRS